MAPGYSSGMARLKKKKRRFKLEVVACSSTFCNEKDTIRYRGYACFGAVVKERNFGGSI